LPSFKSFKSKSHVTIINMWNSFLKLSFPNSVDTSLVCEMLSWCLEGGKVSLKKIKASFKYLLCCMPSLICFIFTICYILSHHSSRVHVHTAIYEFILMECWTGFVSFFKIFFTFHGAIQFAFQTPRSQMKFNELILNSQGLTHIIVCWDGPSFK
jgi:hypothetical protein